MTHRCARTAQDEGHVTWQPGQLLEERGQVPFAPTSGHGACLWVRPTHSSAARLHPGRASSAATVCSAACSQVRDDATPSGRTEDSNGDTIHRLCTWVTRWAPLTFDVQLSGCPPSKPQLVCAVSTVHRGPAGQITRGIDVDARGLAGCRPAIVQVRASNVLSIRRLYVNLVRVAAEPTRRG